MVSEIAKREDNYVPVMLVVTDDADKEVRQARIDPVTKRLKVAASFPGNTDGRIKVSANDTTFNYLLAKLVAGTGITLTENNDGGNETITIDAAGASFYTTVEDDTTPLTQRPSLNFANYFTLSDNAGNTSTDVAINVTQLAGDATFITAMETNLDLANISGVIDLSTQVTGLLDVTNIDVLALAGDSTFVTALAGDTIFTSALDLGDIGGTLDLTTQVTGILPLANGGTGAALSAPAGDRIYFYDQGAGTTAFLTVGSGLDLTGTTLTATATGGSDLQVDVTQVAHGFTAGDVIRSSGVDDTFAKAQADSESNAEVVGLVIAVADVDNFTYTKDVMDYDGAGVPAGTPGNALWLSAATAGAMTMTKPTAVGQVQKPLGQLIASADSINFTADMRGELITNGTSGATYPFVGEQVIGGINYDSTSGADASSVTGFTTNDDGSILYAGFYDGDTGGYITLQEKDVNTGMFYEAHFIGGRTVGLTVLGDYLYVTTPSSPIRRFSKTDLTGGTNMSISSNDLLFAFGADLYINLSGTTWTQHTISGTTLTAATAITGGMTGAESVISDGTYIYMSDGTDVNKYSIVGTAFSLVATNGVAKSLYSLTHVGLGLIDSTKLYVGSQVRIGTAGSTADQIGNLIIKAFSKPA